MQHRTRADLEQVATVSDRGVPVGARVIGFPHLTTREERMRRWADVLRVYPDASVDNFQQIEFHSRRQRGELRQDRSALSLAAADPILRRSGLRDDTYGSAREFFELSHGDMHELLCGCERGQSSKRDVLANDVEHRAVRFGTKLARALARIVVLASPPRIASIGLGLIGMSVLGASLF